MWWLPAWGQNPRDDLRTWVFRGEYAHICVEEFVRYSEIYTHLNDDENGRCPFSGLPIVHLGFYQMSMDVRGVMGFVW